MKRILSILLVCVGFLVFVNSASAAPVDFDTFTATGGADIVDDVLVFDEDVSYDNMHVYNYNFYVNGPNLNFDYYLEVTSESEDYLFVDIKYDNVTYPEFEVGGINSSTDYNDIDIYEGSYWIDLTGYVGKTISLTFGFEWGGLDNDHYADSYGKISNVSVPEPATMLLLGSGLIGLLGLGRRRIFKKI